MLIEFGDRVELIEFADKASAEQWVQQVERFCDVKGIKQSSLLGGSQKWLSPFLLLLKIFRIIYVEKQNKGGNVVAIELVQALITIVKYCATCENCAECQLKDYCGKTFQSY